MTKPILFLDVDGPLNPYEAKATQRPEGYLTKRLAQFWKPGQVRAMEWAEKGLRVWLNPAHGPMLLTLADRFELVWATMWGEGANRLVGPIIGLPELPWVDFGEMDCDFSSKHIPKLAAVARYAEDRPFAWFDDEFRVPSDLNWAAVRNVEIAPTLFMPINPGIGIVQADIDYLTRWGEAVELTQGAA